MEENTNKIGFFEKITIHFTSHAVSYVLASISVAAAMVWVETVRAKDVKEFLDFERNRSDGISQS